MRAQDQAVEDVTAHIAVKDLACRRGGRLLFAHLRFALTAGQAALVSGPNGIGKSSLLRVLAGLLPPFAGTVEAGGAMSLADDRLALDMDRPLAAALGFWARIDGAQPSRRHPGAGRGPVERAGLDPGLRRDDEHGDALTNALHALALDTLAEVPVRMLSTGQRKRAALARTLASGAPIWLLDEPANGLDDRSAAMLGEAVARHRASGGIVIAASHQPLPWPHDLAFTITPPPEAEP